MFGIRIVCNKCTIHDRAKVAEMREKFPDFVDQEGRVYMRIRYEDESFVCKCRFCGQYLVLRIDKQKTLAVSKMRRTDDGVKMGFKARKVA